MHSMDVILYTHRGCPGGQAARRYLDSSGVPYVLRDVLKDEQARAEFTRLGGIGTPMLRVGSRVMHGWDPQEFEQLITTAKEA